MGGPVTWKNIAPTGSGSILEAINESGQLVGTGIAGIGDAFTNYADKRTARDTAALEASLLKAADEKARQEIMAAQDMSFIDQAKVNAIEKARQDEVLEEARWQKRLDAETAATIKINEAKPDKKINVKYGQDPLTGYYEDLHGKDDGWSPWTNAPDADDKAEFSEFRSKFMDEYGNKNKYGDNAISVKQFNEFAKGNVRFSDNWFGDTWDFDYNGAQHNFDDFNDSGAHFYNAMLNSKKKTSQDKIDRGNAFIKFKKDNPQYKTPAEALTAFEKYLANQNK